MGIRAPAGPDCSKTTGSDDDFAELEGQARNFSGLPACPSAELAGQVVDYICSALGIDCEPATDGHALVERARRRIRNCSIYLEDRETQAVLSRLDDNLLQAWLAATAPETYTPRLSDWLQKAIVETSLSHAQASLVFVANELLHAHPDQERRGKDTYRRVEGGEAVIEPYARVEARDMGLTDALFITSYWDLAPDGREILVDREFRRFNVPVKLEDEAIGDGEIRLRMKLEKNFRALPVPAGFTVAAASKPCMVARTPLNTFRCRLPDKYEGEEPPEISFTLSPVKARMFKVNPGWARAPGGVSWLAAETESAREMAWSQESAAGKARTILMGIRSRQACYSRDPLLAALEATQGPRVYQAREVIPDGGCDRLTAYMTGCLRAAGVPSLVAHGMTAKGEDRELKGIGHARSVFFDEKGKPEYIEATSMCDRSHVFDSSELDEEGRNEIISSLEDLSPEAYRDALSKIRERFHRRATREEMEANEESAHRSSEKTFGSDQASSSRYGWGGGLDYDDSYGRNRESKVARVKLKDIQDCLFQSTCFAKKVDELEARGLPADFDAERLLREYSRIVDRCEKLATRHQEDLANDYEGALSREQAVVFPPDWREKRWGIIRLVRAAIEVCPDSEARAGLCKGLMETLQELKGGYKRYPTVDEDDFLYIFSPDDLKLIDLSFETLSELCFGAFHRFYQHPVPSECHAFGFEVFEAALDQLERKAVSDDVEWFAREFGKRDVAPGVLYFLASGRQPEPDVSRYFAILRRMYAVASAMEQKKIDDSWGGYIDVARDLAEILSGSCNYYFMPGFSQAMFRLLGEHEVVPGFVNHDGKASSEVYSKFRCMCLDRTNRFDNCSFLGEQFEDALCVLGTTRGGFLGAFRDGRA